MRIRQKLQALMRNEQGLSTVEYTVLLVLIVAVSVTVWNNFGDRVVSKLQSGSDRFNKHVKWQNN